MWHSLALTHHAKISKEPRLRLRQRCGEREQPGRSGQQDRCAHGNARLAPAGASSHGQRTRKSCQCNVSIKQIISIQRHQLMDWCRTVHAHGSMAWEVSPWQTVPGCGANYQITQRCDRCARRVVWRPKGLIRRCRGFRLDALVLSHQDRASTPHGARLPLSRGSLALSLRTGA